MGNKRPYQARQQQIHQAEEDAPGEANKGTIRLTRRELLATAAVVTLASCAPVGAKKTNPAPTARPFALKRPASVYVDQTVPRSFADAALQRLAGVAGIPSAHLVPTMSDTPDLVLTFGAVPAGYVSAAAGTSPVTAFTHLRVPIDGVSSEQTRGLLSGTITDWQAVGSPYSLPVHVFALRGLPLPAGVTLSQGARVVSSPEALVQELRTQPGSIALGPLEMADWSVRNLGVDGIYPAEGRGDTTYSAFHPFTLCVGVASTLAKRGLEAGLLAASVSRALAGLAPVLDVAVAGDIMLGRGVNNKMVAYHDYLYPYRKIRDELRAADVTVANLECTITDVVPVPTDPYTFTFVTSKQAVNGLVFAGMKIVTVANNHANGSGVAAFLDMLHTLHTHDISTCGGGSTLAQARQPAIWEAQGLRVAILGYDGIFPQGPYATAQTPGLAPIDLGTLPQDIKAARQQADLVIPYFHWGIEYTKDPTIEQQRAAHAAINAGADMVLGNHPHWVQGIESYKGRLIIYSLGNFVFDQDWSRPTMEGMLLHMYWRGRTLSGIRFVPVVDVDRCQPRPMSPAEAVGVFERMWSGTDMLASGQYGPEPE